MSHRLDDPGTAEKSLAERFRFAQARAFPEPRAKIQRAIEFRKQVLKIFDALAGSVATQPMREIHPPEEIFETPKPFTREELYSVRHLLGEQRYQEEVRKVPG